MTYALDSGMSVHVDNLAAQTGFSRFSESSHFRSVVMRLVSAHTIDSLVTFSRGSATSYSKVEGLQRPSEFSTFDFVITGRSVVIVSVRAPSVWSGRGVVLT